MNEALPLSRNTHMAQNTELEVMRSSMEDMRMIIQIQAQIDSLLVEGGEEGPMSARMEVGALRLLRMRQRVLQVMHALQRTRSMIWRIMSTLAVLWLSYARTGDKRLYCFMITAVL